MHAKGVIILLLTVTVLTAVVFAWFNNQIHLGSGKPDVAEQKKSESLGSAIYESGSNPVADSVPDTNPLSDAGENPFDSYKNPFEAQP